MITANEAALVGAFGGAALGGVIGVVGSIFIARYTVKHSGNYSSDIEGIRGTLASLASTQEEMKQQYAKAVQDERTRHEAAEKRAEAARWKPEAYIESKVDGVEQVNDLILKSRDNFYLKGVSLLGQGGAKLEDYQVAKGVATTGHRMRITHASLNKVTNSDPKFSRTDTFTGMIRYTVEREREGVPYTGEIPFHGQRVYLNNTCYYKLTG